MDSKKLETELKSIFEGDLFPLGQNKLIKKCEVALFSSCNTYKTIH